MGVVVPPPEDHACAFRAEAEQLRRELAQSREAMGDVAAMRAELDALKRRVFGKKTEKVTPVAQEVRAERPTDPDRARQRRA